MFSTGTPDGLVVIDIIIGLAFTFFTLSVTASTLLEGIASLLRSRARLLRKAVAQFLDKDTDIFQLPNADSLADEVLKHPLISSLGPHLGKTRATLGVSGGPSYIPSHAFASAFFGVLTKRAGAPNNLGGVAQAISQLNEGEATNNLKAALNAHLGRADTLEELEQHFASFFDDFMDRVTGWYKRYTHVALFAIGFIMAAAWDINTFEYVGKFEKSGMVRCMLVDQAAETVGKETGKPISTTPCSVPAEPDGLPPIPKVPSAEELRLRLCGAIESPVACLRVVQAFLTTLEQPTSSDGNQPKKETALSSSEIEGLANLPGWIVTALAISLGSQFWIGILQSLFSLRSTGAVPARADAQTNLTRPAPASPTPGGTRVFTRTQLEDLQNQLDMPEAERTGELDLRTKGRIAAWQEDRGYPPTGELSMQTFEMIMAPEADPD